MRIHNLTIAEIPHRALLHIRRARIPIAVTASVCAIATAGACISTSYLRAALQKDAEARSVAIVADNDTRSATVVSEILSPEAQSVLRTAMIDMDRTGSLGPEDKPARPEAETPKVASDPDQASPAADAPQESVSRIAAVEPAAQPEDLDRETRGSPRAKAVSNDEPTQPVAHEDDARLSPRKVKSSHAVRQQKSIGSVDIERTGSVYPLKSGTTVRARTGTGSRSRDPSQISWQMPSELAPSR